MPPSGETPSIVAPTGVSGPPLVSTRTTRRMSALLGGAGTASADSASASAATSVNQEVRSPPPESALDANALAALLSDHEATNTTASSRGATPPTSISLSSPSRKRQRIYGDRFIPNRTGQDFRASFSLLHDDGSPASGASDSARQQRRTPNDQLHYRRTEEANRTFSKLLRSEIFENTIPQSIATGSDRSPDGIGDERMRARTPPSGDSSGLATAGGGGGMTPSTPHRNLFTYMSPRHHHHRNSSLGGAGPVLNSAGHPTPSRTPQSLRGQASLNTRSEIYSLSPVRLNSQRMLLTPRKAPRSVSRVPYKVLDAPELADDFYLNLVDWGSKNVLGVGLGNSVYMWNRDGGRVTKLCDLSKEQDTVTSVAWIQRGSHIAIGTGKGPVQIWDAEKCRRLRTLTGHTARVGALAWNDHILTSGSRDRLIYHRDVRSKEQHLRKLTGHKQEVCGLRWNCEDGQLASGGNDNKLMVWDKLNAQPLYKFNEHTAAVKAIAWSPHQRGLLASGGGTADRTIRFWDTKTGGEGGRCIQEVDTGSQVCNLAWSKNSNELVSTHGYSQNQIVVWKYPSLTQVVSLTGHTYRVLYLAMSPDGEVVVTGAGDETLRFWKCFKKKAGEGSGRDAVRSLAGDGWATIR